MSELTTHQGLFNFVSLKQFWLAICRKKWMKGNISTCPWLCSRPVACFLTKLHQGCFSLCIHIDPFFPLLFSLLYMLLLASLFFSIPPICFSCIFSSFSICFSISCSVMGFSEWWHLFLHMHDYSSLYEALHTQLWKASSQNKMKKWKKKS